MNDQNRPADWKHFDEFAAGIATNRLPTTNALRGNTFKITLKSGPRILAAGDAGQHRAVVQMLNGLNIPA